VRKIKEVLRLSHEARLGERQVARSLKISPSTVGEYLRRVELARLGWPLPLGLDGAELERRLPGSLRVPRNAQNTSKAFSYPSIYTLRRSHSC
jgi:hypothetical protein